MSTSVSNLKNRIEREADTQGVELDAVRKIETDSSGQTFRVLAIDAESEEDQVGFQITHPDGPFARDMFEQQLTKSMRKLRNIINDGETVETDDLQDDESTREQSHNARVSETPDEDPRPTDDSGTTESSATITATVELEPGESLEAFQDQLEADLGNLQDAAERLDDLEQRIETIETALEALTSFTQGEDDG